MMMEQLGGKMTRPCVFAMPVGKERPEPYTSEAEVISVSASLSICLSSSLFVCLGGRTGSTSRLMEVKETWLGEGKVSLLTLLAPVTHT